MELDQFVEKFAAQFEDTEMGNIHKDVNFKLLDTWDSLTAFSIQMMIEDDYNVKILPQDFKSVGTVEELFALVESKIV
ncbi:acyl carrier protein [Pedobacter insulae]|uniref:Acyl carrier protein n=1 Tax=Pedobacter insulae TaxID=414048 RepID=A0A1I2YRA6_9SPHI|nr:acyl carrier protein [Pedobacter insulae]SFH28223.1 Acyl carrier protein [Pedobacter insulae]